MTDDAATLVDQNLSVAKQIIETLTRAGLSVATAESLTGGLLSSALVDVPGASECMRGGVTTYQTPMKSRVLAVDEGRLEEYGPVDPKVAEQMALGTAELFDADFGVSTTGVAGPGPSDGHPAGTVYVGVWKRSEDLVDVRRYQFEGDRAEVRAQAVSAALSQLALAVA
ncbi:MAG: CinA family protein [Actinomycetaceae bacterium]|nr:CinA family protein [Actinomycetaceae bacterium]